MNKGSRIAVVFVLVVAVFAVLAMKAQKARDVSRCTSCTVGSPRESAPRAAAPSAEPAKKETVAAPIAPGAKPTQTPVSADTDRALPAEQGTQTAKKPAVAGKPAVAKQPEKSAVATSSQVAVKSETGKPKTEKPKSLPRLLELGSDECVPCKMMVPVLDSLRSEYKGKLQVQFIDVRKDSAAAEKHKVRMIPTQIFFDENGKEFFRHMGFFPKDDILAKFREQGIKL